MSNETPCVVRVERADDIPVLLASLQRLQVPELLDRHFPTGNRWKGQLTFGEVAACWLTFLTSQGDHRLYHVQPWAAQHRHTLQACLGKPVRALDFQDDRLADMLGDLAQPDPWQAFETDLSRNCVRVYRLPVSLVRIDTTTASSYADVLSERGLIQFGHSKDRPDLPQLKIAMAALDPLGLPLTTMVVPGNSADDPWYVPAAKKVQQTFGQGGKTFVFDCKGAALGTRAYLVSTQEHYLCPLTEKQAPKEERRRLLLGVWQGRQPLTPVYRPAANGKTPELVAEGFSFDVQLQAQVAGRQQVWTERRWLVRSLAFAQGQHKQLEKRLHKAEKQLRRLGERKQGKKRLTATQLRAAASALVKEERVQGLLNYQVRTTTKERTVRAYRGRPQRVERTSEQRLEVSRCAEAIEQAKREMGWRVYATSQVEMGLAGVVWGYRGQHRLEKDWSRLKGRPLSLTPMYLESEERMHGLVLLLSVAVRLLTLLEGKARQTLEEVGSVLTEVYPGQPGRQTSRPSAELLLRVFKGINRSVVEVGGQQSVHVTPLRPVQQQVLDLLDLPDDLYQRLTLHFPEPPPSQGEP
jgi:transposase